MDREHTEGRAAAPVIRKIIGAAALFVILSLAL